LDPNIFYTVLAAATATLLGLLFIAVQPNIAGFSKDPQSRWKALAISTFHIYTWVFVMSLFGFIPVYRAQMFRIAPLLGIWRQLRTRLPVWQTSKGRFERWRETLWLLIAPVLIYAALIYFSFQLHRGLGTDEVETNIATAFVIFMVIVLRNTWRLLVEIPSEEKSETLQRCAYVSARKFVG
jgi:cytochrome b561